MPNCSEPESVWAAETNRALPVHGIKCLLNWKRFKNPYGRKYNIFWKFLRYDSALEIYAHQVKGRLNGLQREISIFVDLVYKTESLSSDGTQYCDLVMMQLLPASAILAV